MSFSRCIQPPALPGAAATVPGGAALQAKSTSKALKRVSIALRTLINCRSARSAVAPLRLDFLVLLRVFETSTVLETVEAQLRRLKFGLKG
jgi:hypothetical protein